MASAQVVLGLTPTILSFLGPSGTEPALVTFVSRRPVFAGLLALACPSIYLSRGFEQRHSRDILKGRGTRLLMWCPKGGKSRVLGLTQYLMVILAFINLTTLYIGLGKKTICMSWTNGISGPSIWVLGRFIASVLARRAVIMYEITGMRENYLPNGGAKVKIRQVTVKCKLRTVSAQPSQLAHPFTKSV
ncbi:hypothetical protein GGS21DRAFT_493040 [Xylaria nigripes]|nr:hypothetical protein GGS21DRAFT_493040 [Xylaria nigripes]